MDYTDVGSTTPTYDSRGNMTTGYGGGLTLTYDCENRLLSAGTLNASYSYDLLGRRLSLTIGPRTTQYVWDGAHIIAEYENGSLTKKYIYGPGMDNPVAMINVSGTSESWYYYHCDAQGSIRLIMDSSGTPVESYAYDVYGRPYVMTSAGADGNWLIDDGPTSTYSAIGNPYMFTGRRWDSDTGLYYYRFRDYSPELGRFVQTDPLQYVDGMNMYAYCNNNPTSWVDPWGLETKGEVNKIIGGVSVKVINGVGILNDDILDKIMKPKLEEIDKWSRNPFGKGGWKMTRKRFSKLDSAFHIKNTKDPDPVKRWEYDGKKYHTSDVNYYLQGYGHAHVFHFDWLSRKAVHDWKKNRYPETWTGAVKPSTEFWRKKGFEKYRERQPIVSIPDIHFRGSIHH